MTALAANTYRPGQKGEEREYGVAAAATIYKGGAVAIDDDGYLVPVDETRGRRFVGIASEGADNSSGSDGDKTCRVYRTGIYRFAHATATVDDIGKPVFFDDDNTVVLTSKPVYAGIMVDVDETSGYIMVDIAPAVACQGQIHGVKIQTARFSIDATTDNSTKNFPLLSVPEGFNARLLEARVTNLTAYAKDSAGTAKVDIKSKVGGDSAVAMITQVDLETSVGEAAPFRATLHATDANLVAAEKALIYGIITVANEGAATQATGVVVEADVALYPIGA